MEGFALLGNSYWYPLASIGLNGAFFRIDAHTVIMTWVTLFFLGCFTLFARALLPYNDSPARYFLTYVARMFMEFITQSLKRFSIQHFSFTCSIFMFIFFSSLLSLVPFLEEPTQNLNTALALGISAFLYVQYHHIKAHGIKRYAQGFLAPFFLMLPLNVISTCSTAISLSFRLFGNVFGGTIISNVVFNAIGSLNRFYIGSLTSKIFGLFGSIIGLGGCLIVTLFFGIFEGMLQAFVFFMLTLTYLSLALEGVGH